MALLALALLIPYAFCAAAGVAALRAGSANNWLGRSAVLFSRAFDTGGTIKKTIYPSPAIVRRDAMVLDDLGLIQPVLIKTSIIFHRSIIGRLTAGMRGVSGIHCAEREVTCWLLPVGRCSTPRAARLTAWSLTYEYPERN